MFGYGSLMWRPGFAFEEVVPARIAGFRRALCVYSHVHRGTPEHPGLVLGLDRGGSCLGRAFRVAAARADETIAYLREREQVTAVYLERTARLRLVTDGARAGSEGGRIVEAVAYVADRTHPQYAGALTLEEQLRLVRRATACPPEPRLRPLHRRRPRRPRHPRPGLGVVGGKAGRTGLTPRSFAGYPLAWLSHYDNHSHGRAP